MVDKDGFESVDLQDFLGEEETGSDVIDTGIVVFTEKQQHLVDMLCERLEKNDRDHLKNCRKRIYDLKKLAAAIANFPSLLERADLTVGSRTPYSLVDSLLNSSRQGDMTLQLPSKAILGKGFLVSKLHSFSSFEKLARQAEFDEKICQQFHLETISMMFLLLAEDVYLSLMHDTMLPMGLRQQIAVSLLLLWEHRADQNVSDISPVLQNVWMARTRLAPAFGTMMGTSELIMLSFQLDDQWSDFIRTKLGEPDVNMAMEEFLFGISYEQITKLKKMLREKGISAIGREEVSSYLGENVKTDMSMDYRDFFQQYSIRRDNARVRNRLGIEGPHRTLEDHFICYVMNREKEKQERDAVVEKL